MDIGISLFVSMGFVVELIKWMFYFRTGLDFHSEVITLRTIIVNFR